MTTMRSVFRRVKGSRLSLEAQKAADLRRRLLEELNYVPENPRRPETRHPYSTAMLQEMVDFWKADRQARHNYSADYYGDEGDR